MSDFDKTLHAQLRHLIDDLTVAVDDDGHTRYAPKNTLMFSNFIGALIELMPTLAARAQPAQAVPLLTDEEIQAAWVEHGLDDCAVEDFARAVEQALLAKQAPLPAEQIQKLRHLIDWTDSESYLTFARAIEAAHGIVGKEGA